MSVTRGILEGVKKKKKKGRKWNSERVQSGCQGLGTEIGRGWLMVINIQL